MPTSPKSCPFNHPIKRGQRVEPVNSHFQVVCLDCGAMGPDGQTWAEAVKAWNDRRKTDGKA